MSLAKSDDRKASRRTAVAACLLFVTFALIRIVSTYHIFSQTSDEPVHVVTGMEWLEKGVYTLEPLHPPLARITVALGPYLYGIRLSDTANVFEEGNRLLFSRGRYVHNLALARIGALPFFTLATWLVWRWSRIRYGRGSAVLATFLFTTSPVVMAHAGLATTDMAITATFIAALLVYINLLERPRYSQCALFGLAIGLACLSKFSALVFLPASGFALLLFRWVLKTNPTVRPEVADRFRWRRGAIISAVIAFVVIWAGYRFSVGSITDRSARPHPTIDRLVGTTGILHDTSYSVAESRWIPAPSLWRGLAAVRGKEERGHKGYLLGDIRETGWWYFFPVALAVKTTLALLLLVGVGSLQLLTSAWQEKNWILGAPVVAALAIVIACMPSQINIGVRHILPVYPLLAVIGGLGASSVWNMVGPKYLGVAVSLILLGWQLTSSIRAHPDYLAYFNELAGPHPEAILVDSDLDWGQDLLRLSATLQQRHVEELSIAYAGSAGLDLNRFGLPPFHILNPHQPTAGWIAISLLRLKTGGLGIPTDSFLWLDSYKPVELIGHSILLYYVPDQALGERGMIRAATRPNSGL